ncbi:hypothetical protein HPP92_008027 [Vanilla planifolia]|uniref:Mei2-like C-terminal RNA recognition motif domain-containing protein n=1 Tax=Vanilla planifolia TaxID=51239 RepID=A0A835RBC2_VANPL|nr:hypothetical protein HPP92_008027 [Vanilla planifolia]
MDVYQNEGSTINTFLPRGPANPLKSYSGLISGNSSLRLRTMPPQRMGNMFLGSFPYARQGSSGIEGFSEPVRIHRTDHCGSQLESQQQFQLDLDKIISGDDTRTTLMIKNIPNKYTSEMLLAAIDENHRGAYDFFYLPIDFKNKCNVGYAFINLLSPFHIISFYQAFNGKKWEKFNSEKVASLAYARIQGKAALDVRFQNSSLMNEDRRCRPILFNSMRLEDSDQEPLDDGMSGIYSRRQQTLEPNIPLVGKNVYENADRLVPRNRCGESVEEHEGAEASMCKKL